MLSLTTFTQPVFYAVWLNSSCHLCIWQVNICSVEIEREESAGRFVPELNKDLAENWLSFLFYARYKIKIFLKLLQLVWDFPLILEERRWKKNYLKMKKTLWTKVMLCFIWGAVKTKQNKKKAQHVKVVSPEINKIKASVISITGELFSSKHIWTIDPCSHI